MYLFVLHFLRDKSLFSPLSYQLWSAWLRSACCEKERATSSYLLPAASDDVERHFRSILESHQWWRVLRTQAKVFVNTPSPLQSHCPLSSGFFACAGTIATWCAPWRFKSAVNDTAMEEELQPKASNNKDHWPPSADLLLFIVFFSFVKLCQRNLSLMTSTDMQGWKWWRQNLLVKSCWLVFFGGVSGKVGSNLMHPAVLLCIYSIRSATKQIKI